MFYVFPNSCLWQVTQIRIGLKVPAARNGGHCPDPGLNQGPLDLQSNALPTELSRLTNIVAVSNLVSPICPQPISLLFARCWNRTRLSFSTSKKPRLCRARLKYHAHHLLQRCALYIKWSSCLEFLVPQVRGCSSVVERSLCMWKAPGSIPGISSAFKHMHRHRFQTKTISTIV